MAINLLDKHTAELIAAGEVVERPASVVKELVENALDAGASAITVEIERGGIALMKVEDNGGGIARGDLNLAFVRHATSKVKTGEDLDAIATLGFRGEALASVASVAKVRLLTKRPADENASETLNEGGRQSAVRDAARGAGTTLEVRELFYNTPARMKFLKKDASEGAYVTEAVGRLALSHTGVAFRYIRDGKPVFSTPGNGDLRAAAWQVLGKDFAKSLIEVDGGPDGAYRLTGLITAARAGRASRALQIFFINGRFVKNRTMAAALEQAYRGMSMQGRFPGCVLFLQMPLQLVDVNVHPAKTEVRFANEQEVFGVAYRAVKAALLHGAASHGGLQFGRGAAKQAEADGEQTASGAVAQQLEMPPASGVQLPKAPINEPAQTRDPLMRAAALNTGGLASPFGAILYQTAARAQHPPRARERGLDIDADDEADTPVAPLPEEAALAVAPQTLRLVGEVFRTYILAQRGEALCLIDKHAAHERLLYEKLAAARHGADVQLLLCPQPVTLGAAEKNALLQNGPALAAAGIELEDFGGGAVLVRGVPADVETQSVEALVEEVAGRLAVNARDSLNAKTEWVLHSIACRAAVKAGEKTPPEALLRLAQDILDGAVPPFCPHGRPVVLQISRKELEKQFGRLG